MIINCKCINMSSTQLIQVMQSLLGKYFTGLHLKAGKRSADKLKTC